MKAKNIYDSTEYLLLKIKRFESSAEATLRRSFPVPSTKPASVLPIPVAN